MRPLCLYNIGFYRQIKRNIPKYLRVYLFIYTFALTFKGLGQPKGFILLKMSR